MNQKNETDNKIDFSDLKTKIHFCCVGSTDSGEQNQINSLIISIIKCIQDKVTQNHIIIVNDFAPYYKSTKRIPFSSVFDIERLNSYLKKYNIQLVDKNFVQMNIIAVEYGINETYINITDKVVELFYKDNLLKIDKNTNINSLYNDPVPGVKKELVVQYTINNTNYRITEIFQENGFVYIDYSSLNHKRWLYNPEILNNSWVNHGLVNELLENLCAVKLRSTNTAHHLLIQPLI
jgi:hypothetical protein